ncbi:MAG: HNH endonuclease [Spirochaetales bacterium]|nr:HNH endonuclease [Spirochaetales bacterium]
MKFEPAAFEVDLSEDHIKKEKAKARKLRDSAWWKRKSASGLCHYCGGTFRPSELTMDHKIPLGRGGASTRENLVPCCKKCNTEKKNLLPAEWQSYLERLASR